MDGVFDSAVIEIDQEEVHHLGDGRAAVNVQL